MLFRPGVVEGNGDKELSERRLEANAISPDAKAKIVGLFDVGKMSDAEIMEKCGQADS